ncbi:MAG TPA: hypothetical protein VMD79_15850 [Solirubrobacteraceae bacterium]|nr:hypothetical protein [Solirubrobacteraceae bacterium]
MTPSHRLKLDRAYEHLVEIEALTKPLRERREYPVIETMKPYKNGPRWDYTLDLTAVQPPERLPILMGDYMFNVRSALDHIAVGLGPRKYRRKLSFPIFTRDPLARDQRSREYLNAEAARRWLDLCCCLPDDRIAPLMVLQPYQAAALHSHRGDHHALALLSSFQNADKHRELIPAVVGLELVEVEFDGIGECPLPGFKNGTVIVANAPAKMDVKVKGIARVGIERGNETWSFDLLAEKLGTFIVNELLPRLEPLLK